MCSGALEVWDMGAGKPLLRLTGTVSPLAARGLPVLALLPSTDSDAFWSADAACHVRPSEQRR
jgi:hypothetical protein